MSLTAWLAVAVVSAGTGPRAVTSFDKAADVVAFFGRAYPVPNSDGGFKNYRLRCTTSVKVVPQLVRPQ